MAQERKQLGSLGDEAVSARLGLTDVDPLLKKEVFTMETQVFQQIP